MMLKVDQDQSHWLLAVVQVYFALAAAYWAQNYWYTGPRRHLPPHWNSSKNSFYMNW